MVVNRPFDVSSIVVRLSLSLTVVFGTYNPTGRSYFHWVVEGNLDTLVFKTLIGLMLVGIYWMGFTIV